MQLLLIHVDLFNYEANPVYTLVKAPHQSKINSANCNNNINIILLKLKCVQNNIGIPMYHEPMILVKAGDAEKRAKDLSDDAGAVCSRITVTIIIHII